MLLTIADYERAARRRLPRTAFDVIAGGAGDEVTLRDNRSAFDRWSLRPRALTDVTTRDLATTVLGTPVSMPLLLAPCGFARMAHGGAEPAVARAAARSGTVYALSTVSSHPLETVAAQPGDRWFQLYPPADRRACGELIDRAAAAGYRALVVTVDGATPGLRERDRRNRLSIPLRPTPRMVAEAALRPRWSLDFILGGAGRGRLGAQRLAGRPASLSAATRAIAATARSITRDELEFVRGRWSGPLAVKGILRGDEVEQLLEIGADAVVVSNHGGRQLDTVPAALDALPDVVDAVRGRAEVLVDGGFRRGSDVVAALALGARAVLVGRPYLWGLAVGGEQGVHDVLEILRSEIDRTLCLLGATGPGDVDRSMVGPRGPDPFAGRPVAPERISST